MRVLHGHSPNASGQQAVAEATAGWSLAGKGLDLLIAFSSTAQDPGQVATAFAERFPDTPMIGCTTAGEHLNDHHYNGHLVVAGLSTPSIRWATQVAPHLDSFDESRARALSDELLAGLGLAREDLDPQKHFCLTFIDGLSCKEEVVSSLMADALEGVPLLGGRRRPSRSSSPAPTSPRAAVRDGWARGHQGHAAALGMPVSEVTSDVSFMNPLTFVCNNGNDAHSLS